MRPLRRSVREDSNASSGIQPIEIPKGEERRLLQFTLLGPLFSILLVLCLTGLGGWLLWLPWSGLIESFRLQVFVMIAGGMLALVGLGLGWAMLTLRPEEEPYVTISRDDAPKLWAIIDDLAQALHAPPHHHAQAQRRIQRFRRAGAVIFAVRWRSRGSVRGPAPDAGAGRGGTARHPGS